MPEKIPSTFDIQIYGDLTPYELNPSMSKARVSTFRKYGNVNGSYFTDAVAEEMIKTIPGQPIVGKYDEEKKDFTRHFTIADTKAYGFVPPENYHFAWETRTENDGTQYEYACFDVVLWTDRYAEAREIMNKGQSMELNAAKVQGDWTNIDGKSMFVYTSAPIFGLCILGDDVQPCFDGACFYEKQEYDFEQLLNNMKEEIKTNFSLLQGGKKPVEYKINLPQDTMAATVFEHLNPAEEGAEFTTANNIVLSANDISSTYFSLADSNYYTLGYSVTTPNYEVTDTSATITPAVYTYVEPTKIFSMVPFSTEDEYNDYKKLADSGKTFAAWMEEFEAMKAENESVAAERDRLAAELGQANTRIAEYEQKEADALSAKKDEIIKEYEGSVDEDAITDAREHKDEYSLEQIEGKLAVNFARKAREQKGPHLIPNFSNNTEDPVLALLNKHNKKN